MPDQTIDAIKVRLGVDTKGISAGVDAANTALDRIGSKTRVVRVHVEATQTANRGAKSLKGYMADVRADIKKNPIKVPIETFAQETGQFGVGKMRSKIATALAQGGGVNVPIKVALDAASKSAIKADISRQLSPVTIYFDWVARNSPGHPPGTANVSTDPGPGGGTSGGGATPSGTSTGRGRQPGETKKDASDRHKAEHAARTAQTRTDKAATDNADATRKALEKEYAELKKERDRLAASMAGGAAGGAGGAGVADRPGRSPTQQRLDQQIAADRKKAKDAEERAAKTESQKVRERSERTATAARERIAGYEKERRAEAKRLRDEARASAPVTPTPAAEPAPVAGGTGSRPRPARAPRTSTGAPATGEASAAPVTTLGHHTPHPSRGKGSQTLRTRNRPGFRVGERPRGEGADRPYGEGMSAEGGPYMSSRGIRMVQGLNETEAQLERAEAEADFAEKMRAAGVEPSNYEASRGFITNMRPGARRKMYQSMGLATNEVDENGNPVDPLSDMDTLSAFLGKLLHSSSRRQEQATQSGGQTETRLAGARKGGKAGGGGEMAGSKGGTIGAAHTRERVEDVQVPVFGQEHIGAAEAGIVPPGFIGPPSPGKLAPEHGTDKYEIGGKRFTYQGAVERSAREIFEKEQAEALKRRGKIAERTVGPRGPETDEIRAARESREAAESAKAAETGQKQAAIRDRLIAEGVPSALIPARIEAEMRGIPRSTPAPRRRAPRRRAAPKNKATVGDFAAKPLDLSGVPEFAFSEKVVREPEVKPLPIPALRFLAPSKGGIGFPYSKLKDREEVTGLAEGGGLPQLAQSKGKNALGSFIGTVMGKIGAARGMTQAEHDAQWKKYYGPAQRGDKEAAQKLMELNKTKVRKRGDGGAWDSEELDRLFGDKPGMWWDKSKQKYGYAHEQETTEERIKRNQREANEAYWGRSREPRARQRRQEQQAGPGSGAAGGRVGATPQVDTRIDKLKRMATQTEQSPNEAEIARRKLREAGIEGYAEGGAFSRYMGRAGAIGRAARGGWGSAMRLAAQVKGAALIPPFPGKGAMEDDEEGFNPLFSRLTPEETQKRGEWLWGNVGSDKSAKSRMGFARDRLLGAARSEKREGKRPLKFRGGASDKYNEVAELYEPGIGEKVQGVDTRDPDYLASRGHRHKLREAGMGGADYPSEDISGDLHILGRNLEKMKRGPGGMLDPRLSNSRKMDLIDFLDKQTMTRNAEGGILKHTGLVGRANTRLTMVGERGPELIEEDQNGNAEVIPSHKIGARLNKRVEGGEYPGFFGRGLDRINIDRRLAREKAEREAGQAEILEGARSDIPLLPATATPTRPRGRANRLETPDVIATPPTREARAEQIRGYSSSFTRLADAREARTLSEAMTKVQKSLDAEADILEESLKLGARGEHDLPPGMRKIEIERADIDIKNIDVPTFMRNPRPQPQPAAAPGPAVGAPAQPAAAGFSVNQMRAFVQPRLGGRFAVAGTPGAAPLGSPPGAAPPPPPTPPGGAGHGRGGAGAAPPPPPGGPAAGAPPPGGNPPPGPIPTSAAARETARAAGRGRRPLSPAEQGRLELAGIRADISEKQAIAPVRALSVSIGQIFSTLSGRAGIISRAREASTLTDIAGQRGQEAERLRGKSREQAAELKIINDFQKSGNVLTDRQIDRQAELVKLIKNRGAIIRQTVAAEKESLATAKTATENIVTTSSAIKNIGASALGISVGTLAFSAAYGALNTAVEGFVDVTGKAIERSSGFQNVAGKTTSAIADQTREMFGASKAATALSFAAAGVSAAETDAIGPTVQRRAEVEAGNKALVDAVGLLHTYEAVTAQNKGQPGGEKALSRTTAGLFGQFINGIPSTAEIVGNELAGVPAAGVPDQGALGFFPNDAEKLRRAQEGIRIWEDMVAGTYKHKPGDPINVTEEQYQRDKATVAQIGQGDMGVGRLRFFNEALEKGGQGLLKFEAQTTALTDAQRQEMVDAANAGGAFGIAEQIAAKKIVLTKAGAEVFDPKVFTQALEAINESARFQEPDVLLKQLESQPGRMGPVEAQIRGIQREGLFERGTALPAAAAMRGIARPPVPFMDPRQFPSAEGKVGGIDIGGAAKEYEAAFSAYSDKALPAQKAVTDQIAKGRMELEKMGVPPQLLDDIGQIGKDIQSIQLGISQRGLNLQVAEYNNQLRIAKRSLSDAKDFMSGLHGATGDTLGALEGMNAALGRQLQLLQQELAQRQINFKLATAGFVAPGTTPEERAARIEAAKKEAEFAQKQLDIQKQMSANQFQTVGIGAERNVTDIQAQIGLLTEGRALTIDTAAAQASIEALQEQQTILIEQAQSYSNQGQKIAALYMSTWTEIETRSGKVMTGLSKGLNEAFQSAGEGFVTGLESTLGAVVAQALSGGFSGGALLDRSEKAPQRAAGYSGYHSTPTTMTVGDAGGEEVAVLRNPRRMMMQMGGGGEGVNVGGITVIVNGSGGEDPEVLAATIARKVEETLMRKTSLFGLRRA